MGLDMYLESHKKETYELHLQAIDLMQEILNYRHKDSKETFVDDDEWVKVRDSLNALINNEQEKIA